jgi:hypothetical protein
MESLEYVKEEIKKQRQNEFKSVQEVYRKTMKEVDLVHAGLETKSSNSTFEALEAAGERYCGTHSDARRIKAV